MGRAGALVLAVLAIALTLVPDVASAQVSGLGVAITPAFTTGVAVGDTNKPGIIQFINGSFGTAVTDVVTLTNIRMNTSCQTSAVDPTGPSPCFTPDPRPNPALPLLTINPASTAGTTCPGGPFNITGPDAEGDYTFTPTTGAVTLAPLSPVQPGSTCQIAFTFNVNQRPNDGATFQPAALLATSPTFPGGSPQTGVSQVTVNPATPAIVTLASAATVVPGGSFTDAATVTGVANGPTPTGTVSFTTVFDPPGAVLCSGTSTVLAPPSTLTGPAPTPPTPPTASATSPSVTATVPGTYHFVATYSGDVNYAALPATSCGAANENVTVSQFQATLSTQASTNSPVVPVGTVVTDTATLTPPVGAPAPTGTITYTLVGPNPGPTCAAPVVGAPSTVAVGQPSAPFTVLLPGVYNFVATYSGDANYTAISTPVGCNVLTERFTAVLPTIAVDKSANPTVVNEPGAPVTFTVKVTNTGPLDVTLTTLTDNVYGNLNGKGTCVVAAAGSVPPTAPLLAANGGTFTCSFTGQVPVAGAGAAGQSQTDIVTATGTDVKGNTASATDDATVNIVGVPPVITVFKAANPLTLPEPGGTFTFTVRVRNDSAFESVTITSLIDNIYGNLATRPGSTCGALIGTVLAVGATSSPCSFTGPFTGDANQTQTDTVTGTAVDTSGKTATNTATATVGITDVLPTVRVVKTASPLSKPAPGGTFTFTAVVTNTSIEPITITSLVDNIYGNLATRVGSTCGALIGSVLAPGASSPACTFPGDFTGVAGNTQTDIVTVNATDNEGNTAVASDDATVTITGAPSIRVDKGVQPSSLPEPGGTFTFSAVVTNTSPQPLTITNLVDNIYGDLATRPGSTCGALIGTVLAPAASTPVCTFPGNFTGVAGASQTDTVTVTGHDAAGTVVTDTDQATVTLTNVVPVIAVRKTANPLTRTAPGGAFTFTVVVTNTSTIEPVTITALTDNVYGNIATLAGSTCGALIGTTLAPSASSPPCSFTGNFAGAAGASQTDTVTATATDASGTVVTAMDHATVSIISITPAIRVDKSATPPTMPAPGGTFTFGVVVTNTGPNSLTITTLVDNIYGNIATKGTCTTAIGTVLASGASYTCSFPGVFNGVGGASQTDTVTVTGVDINNTSVSDTDNATVTLTTVTPTVRVTKAASPLTLPEPGGTFTFTAQVTNTSTEAVTITSLNDNIYGNLATRAGSTCGALIGTTLAPGASSPTCSFTGSFIADAGASQSDLVTVVVTDSQGTTATDTAKATVSITNVPPTITVVKTANPLSKPAPGGTFTFTVLVTNTSFEPVTITSLSDNVYGALAGKGTCALGAVLAANGGTYTCNFPGDFTGVAGAAQTDTVTVVAVDNDNSTVTAQAQATVFLTGAPSIRVDKGVQPSSLPEPGGTFTFSAQVTNTSPQPLTITNLVDNIYGDLATRAGSTCGALIGTVLAPAASTPVCTFPGNFTGVAGASQTDTVTVTGHDAAGTVVTDTDQATVTLTNVVPVIAVRKTANPLTRTAPGGAFTFTVVVTNTSTIEPVTITALTDNVYGNIATLAGSTCGALIGTTLAPSASSPPCSFTGNFAGAAGASQTDTVTATATDASGTVVTAMDHATVSIISITPAIRVDKSATPPTMPAPGGTFTFGVVVTNTGPNSLTITTLVDNIYGNIATKGTCTTAIGTVLASGASYTCSFPGVFNGVGGASQTDTVTVTGVDINNTSVSDTDNATVTLTTVTPTVRVTKAASPLTLPEPGGTFTFTAQVTNTSTEAVTITSLNDNIYGNLATRAGSTCGALIGTTLAPGASSPTCSFTGSFIADAGASQSDLVTVVVTDSQGTTATDTAKATVSITNVPPTITVVKTANPLSKPAPGGTFTFTVVVNNTSAESVTVTSLVDNIYGNLATRAGSTCGAVVGSVLAAGASSPPCTFPGDFTGVAGNSQTDIVTAIVVDNDNSTASAMNDATVFLTGGPSIRVDKGVQPSSLPEPGGTFTFSAQVTNTSPQPLTITNLVDNIYGDLATRAGSTCGALIGTVLAPAASTPVCTFPGNFTGVAGASQTDTVTVTGHDAAGTVVTDTDQATVTLTNVVPVIAVRKTANPLTRTAPGGAFTFTVVVTNTSTIEPVTITALTDNVYGNIATLAGSTCGALIGTTLAPSASSPPCSFTGNFAGAAGASQTDTVTATATDASGTVVTAMDHATVSIISITPAIRVDKSATPPTMPAPGGTFTFGVVVTNTGPNSLTITTLVDNIYGNIATKGTCTTAIGTVLASGASYTCSFPGVFNGVGGASQTDTVTVTGVDINNTSVSDTDNATVTLTTVTPTVRVTKAASPLTLPEPGGTFTFTAQVTNTSTEAVTITSLNDNIYGNLATRAGSTCGALIGTTLAPGASSPTCSFTGSFIADAGASQSDLVTVVVTDSQGTTATDTAKATVSITNVPPTITVVKTANPLSKPAPGGTFTFTVLVTNTSFEPVTITSLSDNVYGALAGKGTCALGAVLAANGGTYTCNFPGDFTGVPNASQTDTVTVVAVDNDSSTVTAMASATVTLTPLPATLTTAASAGVVGGEVFDTATLAGGFNPTGTITFKLFNNETCAGTPVFSSVNPVTGTTDPRIVTSGHFVIPATGVYHFVATYSGDANNAATGPTACLDPNETVGIGRLGLALSTQASPPVTIGGSIFDTALIAGGFNPTGTVTFNVYGPDATVCTGTPVFTSTKTVNGNGSYASGPFTPTAAGVYRFVASYSGDANNAPTTTSCDDPLERVAVAPLPVIQIAKTAIPDSLPTPGGTAVFNVVVTNPNSVALTIRSLIDNVYGDVTQITAGTCGNAIGTVLTPSPGPGNTYTCRFTGDVHGVTGSSQTDVVTVSAVDSQNNTVSAHDDATVTIVGLPPTITTTKMATQSSLPEPGGTFTFTYSVTNTGPDPVTVTSLVDDVYGNLNGKGTCAVGTRLVTGATYTCSFSGTFFANAGGSQTDTITTTAVDDRGQSVLSQSHATVTITNVLPTIQVTKTPDPLSRPEPGGSFRFTVTVTNTSFESVTITSLVDNVYGDLNGRGSCATGVVLAAAGGSYSCSFDGNFTGRGGDAQTDTVSVTVVDNDNSSATVQASARVTITPVGTLPVLPPPTLVPTIPIPTPVPPLARTGSNALRQMRLAGLFLLAGMALVVAANWRFGRGGTGLVPVPTGPDSGGGGGDGFGGASWFGGLPPRPPISPLGGFGLALAPPAVPDVDSDVDDEEDDDPVPEVGGAEVVVAADVVVAAEVIEATVVRVQTTTGLDAVALDAANADLFRPRSHATPPPGSRHRSRGFGRH